MSRFTDELFDLVQKIINGKCNKVQANTEIARVERAYPNEKFPYFKPERTEKSTWNMSYLKELENLYYSGANSKEFILYMAEVSEEIYRAKRIRKVILCSLLAVAMVILLFVLFQTFRRK